MCSTEVKLTLLRTFCSPMYTAQLWWNYTVASIHKLHVAYNNVFRLLLNQPKYCSASTMFVEYHVPDSKAVIRNLVYKFMRRLDASYNKLVIAIINSDIKWQSRIRRHWIKNNENIILLGAFDNRLSTHNFTKFPFFSPTSLILQI